MHTLSVPPTKTSRSLALAFNAKQSKDQEVFEKILKRNATSPFVKLEDKPLTTKLSIKAEPTIGTLAILEPPKPQPVEAPQLDAAEVTSPVLTNEETSGQAIEQTTDQPVATQEFNPISSEVVTPSANASVTPPQAVAVPQQAERLEPQS